ncbi:MAG: hypothetical protein WBF90_06295 [Rivularia sp. (in: cyanobacteria)]
MKRGFKELGSGWSWATDEVRQRMELGNGWSWATDGVRQRMELRVRSYEL